MSKKELVSYLLAQNTSISLTQTLICLLSSVLLGLFLYFVYRKTYSGVAYSKNFNLTLVLIAVITTLAMLVIGNNLALSLGMVGSLSIIRFRTAVKEPRDIAFLFWAISIGLSCGSSMYLIAIVGSLILAALLFGFSRNIYDSSAYLLVLRAQGGPLPGPAVQELLQSQTARFRLRMQNTAPDGEEATWEVFMKAKSDPSELVRAAAALEGISSANLVTYSGESLG